MDDNAPVQSAAAGSRKAFWIVFAVIVLGGVALYAAQRRPVVQAPSGEGNNQVATGTPIVPGPSADAGIPAQQPQTVTVNVEGGMFYFAPKEIRVKEGQTVKIVFTNKEGMHDWGLDEFDARTPVITAGQTATVEFVASRKGNFEYYCSVGNHRAQGMKGTLVVE